MTAVRVRGRHFHRHASAAAAGTAPQEHELQSQIRAALEYIGCVVTNLSAPRRSHVTPGTPDLYASHAARGLRVWVETKAADGKLSKAQKAWHEAERAAGGTVLVVRSVTDAMEQWAALPRRQG